MKGNSAGESPTGIAGGDPALTPAQFHILLTLADESRHGYGIMQEIRERTEGALVLGPGTLYRSIKQLLERGLITGVEIPATDAARADEERRPDARRRPYTLTPAGRIRLREEAHRLRALVRWADEAIVLESGK